MHVNGKARAILLGDLNVAPLEHDVWSHKQLLDVVSHTPIECEKLIAAQKAGGWVDAMREFVPEPAEALHLVELSLARLEDRRQGPRLDHIWVAPALVDRVSAIKIVQGSARLGAALRPCAGDGDVRGCERLANLLLRQAAAIEQAAHDAGCHFAIRSAPRAPRAIVNRAAASRGIRHAFQHLQKRLREMRITVEGSTARSP